MCAMLFLPIGHNSYSNEHGESKYRTYLSCVHFYKLNRLLGCDKLGDKYSPIFFQHFKRLDSPDYPAVTTSGLISISIRNVIKKRGPPLYQLSRLHH